MDGYKEHFKEILKGYGLDVFNMDETSLFYRLLPNHTLCNKAKVSGIKNSKDRVSVVFYVSYTGEKLAPLVIGKAATPRSFKRLDLKRIGMSIQAHLKVG